MVIFVAKSNFRHVWTFSSHFSMSCTKFFHICTSGAEEDNLAYGPIHAMSVHWMSSSQFVVFGTEWIWRRVRKAGHFLHIFSLWIQYFRCHRPNFSFVIRWTCSDWDRPTQTLKNPDQRPKITSGHPAIAAISHDLIFHTKVNLSIRNPIKFL